MIFNSSMTLRGKPIITAITKGKGNRTIIELDRYKNQTFLLFDSCAFEGFLNSLNEYSKTGKLSYSPSENCQSQIDLDVFSLDLRGPGRFSTRLDLGDLIGDVNFILRSGYTLISFHFNQDQLIKIATKLKAALDGQEILTRAQRETII